MTIYLASQSPRRQALLKQIGITFELVSVEVNEDWDSREQPQTYVERMAREKAMAGMGSLDDNINAIVIGADTAVVIDDLVLGKAGDREQASRMLSRLSGRKHHVYSSVAVLNDQGIAIATSISGVCFKKLSTEEITGYCNTGEPTGKAGGYAIQGRGAIFVEYLEGSYSGVMGLPLYETVNLLHQAGADLQA